MVLYANICQTIRHEIAKFSPEALDETGEKNIIVCMSDTPRGDKLYQNLIQKTLPNVKQGHRLIIGAKTTF